MLRSVDFITILENRRSVNADDGFLFPAAEGLQNTLAADIITEGNIGAIENKAGHEIGDVRFLRFIRLQEAQPYGCIEKQHFHADVRAVSARRFDNFAEFSAVRSQPIAIFAADFGSNGHLGHRRDGSHGFAAKPERHNPFEVVRFCDFTCGVRKKRRVKIVAGDTAAVVHDADQLFSAPFDVNLDFRRARVYGVFDELLGDRVRPVHDLARRNPIIDLRG